MTTQFARQYSTETIGELDFVIWTIKYRNYRIISCRTWIDNFGIITKRSDGWYESNEFDCRFHFLDTFNTTPVMIISQSLMYSFNMQVITTSQVTTTTGPKIKFISPNEYSSQRVNATVNFIVIGDLPSY